MRLAGDGLAPAPYPPGTPGLSLGSDTLRRDMLSRLIYGSRYTLLFSGVAALLRVGLGGLLGVLAGWNQRLDRVFDVLAGVWSAVPSLLFALIPIALVNRRVGVAASALTFVLVMSLTGWAEIAVRCRVAVRGLLTQPFVEAAYAVGLRPGRVLRRHILPNLHDLLLIEAAYAIGAVLLLVAELGFLGVYVGYAEPETLGSRVIVSDPIYAEWGSMLARGLRQRGSGLWLMLEPLAVFALAILAFNLLAEGLRRR
jgi:peptide/nickel transport system permease protein